MIKTLYITDLDGTLLSTERKINSESLAMINDMTEQGLPFTYATARSLISARKVTQGLNLKLPVIVYNGAHIMDANNGSILYSCSFKKEERQYVETILEEFHVSPLVYSFVDGIEKVIWNTEKENDGISHYIDSRKDDPRITAVSNAENLYQGDIFYYTCIGSQEELQPIYDRLKDNENYHCILQQELYRPEYWCEIMPRKATKAEAMKHLKELLGYDRIVSFGDAFNDIPMFLESDEAYAVSNAVAQLKEVATGVIDSNDNNGVAMWLKRHCF